MKNTSSPRLDWRLLPLLVPVLLMQSGCWMFENDDEGNELPPPDPPSLSYGQPEVVWFQGLEIDSLLPTLSNYTEPVQYAVTPALPPGVAFFVGYGGISGMPVEPASRTQHTITAHVPQATTDVIASTTLWITVAEPNAPSNLSYSANPALYAAGQPIEPNIATVTGGVTDWSVDPALPYGLILSSTNGTISGSTVLVAPPTDYIVTASNPYGSTQATLQIELIPARWSRAVWVANGDGTLSHAQRQYPDKTFLRTYTATGCSMTSLSVSSLAEFVFGVCDEGEIHRFEPDPETAEPDAGTVVGNAPGATRILVSANEQRLLALGGGMLRAFEIDALGQLCCEQSVNVSAESFAMEMHPEYPLVYVLTGSSSSVSTYRTQPTLEPLGQDVMAGGYPASMEIEKAGEFAYVLNFTSNSISLYRTHSPAEIDAGMTPLTPLTTPEVSLGAGFVQEIESLTATHGSTRRLFVSANTPGRIYQFSIENDGSLEPLSTPTVAVGPSPIRLRTDSYGEDLYILDNALEEVWIFRQSEGGQLQIRDRMRTRDLPAELVLPEGRQVYEYSAWVFTTSRDADEIQTVALEYSGQLVPTAQGPVATDEEPNAVAIDRARERVYVANRGSDSVSLFELDAVSGSLTPSTPPSIPVETNPIALALEPSGRFLYVLGATWLRAFRIAPGAGGLTPIGNVHWLEGQAESLGVEPTGQWVYSVSDNFVEVWTIDAVTGDLTGAGSSPSAIDAKGIAFAPLGRFAWISDASPGASGLHMYEISPQDGRLSVLSPGFIAAGTGTSSIAVHPGGLELYAANEGSFDASIFDVDALTGVLTPRGAPNNSFVTAGAPVNLAIDAAGYFLLVAVDGPGVTGVQQFSLVAGDGQGATETFMLETPSGPLGLGADIVSSD